MALNASEGIIRIVNTILKSAKGTFNFWANFHTTKKFTTKGNECQGSATIA